MELSIDKKEITDVVLEGSGIPADRLIPEVIPGFDVEKGSEDSENSEKNYGILTVSLF